MPARHDASRGQRDPSSGARRARRYEDAMRARGLVKKHLWVPADRAGEIEAMAARLRGSSARGLDLGEILGRLRARRDEIEAAGVRHLGVFGSTARGEAGAGSDIDLLVTLDPNAPIGLFALVALRRSLGELLGHAVDLVTTGGLRPEQRAEIEQDIVLAF